MTTNTIQTVGGSASTQAAAATTNHTPLGDLANSNTEASVTVTMQDGGVYSHMYIVISANTVTANTTYTNRRNSAGASQTVTATASTTGEFEDVSNTDTVAATEKYDYRIVAGATGTNIAIVLYSMLFAATTDTVSITGARTIATQSVASTTNFFQIGGLATGTNTTEANAKTTQRKAGTMSHTCATVSTNTRAQASTARGRLNGANGALVATITGNTTGNYQDTTHSDTIAVADDWCFAYTTGTSTGNLAVQQSKVSFTSTNNDGVINGGNTAGVTQNVNITRFYQYGSNPTAATTENAFVQMKARDTFTLSQLTIFASANTVTADSTLTSRKNAGAGSLTVTITNNTAGVFSDTVNTESDVSTDDINTQLVTGATGTSVDL